MKPIKYGFMAFNFLFTFSGFLPSRFPLGLGHGAAPCRSGTEVFREGSFCFKQAVMERRKWFLSVNMRLSVRK
jgi:hypothetical protein